MSDKIHAAAEIRKLANFYKIMDDAANMLEQINESIKSARDAVSRMIGA
jgi:uncharacterized protein YukE